MWEVKTVPCWTPGSQGAIGPQWLVVARNALHPEELKYFISDAAPGVPLEVILHVAFGRWPVERCLQDEKSELGLSHFEARRYPAIKRHLLITQVSHLFLARQTQRLRGEKSGGDLAPVACRRQRVDRRSAASADSPAPAVAASGVQTPILAGSQRRRSPQPRQTPQEKASTTRHSPLSITPMRPRINVKRAL